MMRQIHNSGLDEAAVLAQAPEQEGECYGWCCKPQSSDTSNMKLSIRRTEDGTVLAHCFHCGHSGAWIPDQRILTTDEMRAKLGDLARSSAARPQQHDVGGVGTGAAGGGESEGGLDDGDNGRQLPPMNDWQDSYLVEDIGYAWSNPEVPDSVYHMLYGRWRLTPHTVRHQQIHAWVRGRDTEVPTPHSSGDAWLSVGSQGNPTQYRRVGDTASQYSKWFTVSRPDTYPVYRTSAATGHLVVTEDIPSALYLAQSGKGSYMALMGTSLDLNRLPKKTIAGPIIINVWLDNDSAAVIRKAKDIALQLGKHYGCPATTVNCGDPKDYNPYT